MRYDQIFEIYGKGSLPLIRQRHLNMLTKHYEKLHSIIRELDDESSEHENQLMALDPDYRMHTKMIDTHLKSWQVTNDLLDATRREPNEHEDDYLQKVRQILNSSKKTLAATRDLRRFSREQEG